MAALRLPDGARPSGGPDDRQPPQDRPIRARSRRPPAATVERLLVIGADGELQCELGAKRVKRAALELEATRAERDESEQLARLEERIAELESRLDAIEDGFDPRS